MCNINTFKSPDCEYKWLRLTNFWLLYLCVITFVHGRQGNKSDAIGKKKWNSLFKYLQQLCLIGVGVDP